MTEKVRDSPHATKEAATALLMFGDTAPQYIPTTVTAAEARNIDTGFRLQRLYRKATKRFKNGHDRAGQKFLDKMARLIEQTGYDHGGTPRVESEVVRFCFGGPCAAEAGHGSRVLGRIQLALDGASIALDGTGAGGAVS